MLKLIIIYPNSYTSDGERFGNIGVFQIDPFDFVPPNHSLRHSKGAARLHPPHFLELDNANFHEIHLICAVVELNSAD